MQVQQQHDSLQHNGGSSGNSRRREGAGGKSGGGGQHFQQQQGDVAHNIRSHYYRSSSNNMNNSNNNNMNYSSSVGGIAQPRQRAVQPLEESSHDDDDDDDAEAGVVPQQHQHTHHQLKGASSIAHPSAFGQATTVTANVMGDQHQQHGGGGPGPGPHQIIFSGGPDVVTKTLIQPRDGDFPSPPEYGSRGGNTTNTTTTVNKKQHLPGSSSTTKSGGGGTRQQQHNKENNNNGVNHKQQQPAAQQKQVQKPSSPAPAAVAATAAAEQKQNNKPAATAAAAAPAAPIFENGTLLRRRWLVTGRIGGGAFGETFSAVEVTSNEIDNNSNTNNTSSSFVGGGGSSALVTDSNSLSMSQACQNQSYHQLLSSIADEKVKYNGTCVATGKRRLEVCIKAEKSIEQRAEQHKLRMARIEEEKAREERRRRKAEGIDVDAEDEQAAKDKKKKEAEQQAAAAAAQQAAAGAAPAVPPVSAVTLRNEVLALKRAQPCPLVVRYLTSGKTQSSAEVAAEKNKQQKNNTEGGQGDNNKEQQQDDKKDNKSAGGGGVNFIVMPKMGENMASLRRKYPNGVLDLYYALRLSIACLDAIEGCHRCGLVHRDIKPSNFLMQLFPEESTPAAATAGVENTNSNSSSNSTPQHSFLLDVYPSKYVVLNPEDDGDNLKTETATLSTIAAPISVNDAILSETADQKTTAANVTGTGSASGRMTEAEVKKEREFETFLETILSGSVHGGNYRNKTIVANRRKIDNAFGKIHHGRNDAHGGQRSASQGSIASGLGGPGTERHSDNESFVGENENEAGNSSSADLDDPIDHITYYSPFVTYAIDFGLAKRYTENGNKIKPPREKAGFRGTSRYASLNSHQHKDLGRVDDLWSLLFMIVEFITGTLPWRKLKDKDAIGERKTEWVGPRLVKFLPRELTQFVNHLLSLDFYAEPDYAYLRKLLETTIKRKFTPEEELSWIRKAVSTCYNVDLYDEVVRTRRRSAAAAGAGASSVTSVSPPSQLSSAVTPVVASPASTISRPAGGKKPSSSSSQRDKPLQASPPPPVVEVVEEQPNHQKHHQQQPLTNNNSITTNKSENDEGGVSNNSRAMRFKTSVTAATDKISKTLKKMASSTSVANLSSHGDPLHPTPGKSVPTKTVVNVQSLVDSRKDEKSAADVYMSLASQQAQQQTQNHRQQRDRDVLPPKKKSLNNLVAAAVGDSSSPTGAATVPPAEQQPSAIPMTKAAQMEETERIKTILASANADGATASHSKLTEAAITALNAENNNNNNNDNRSKSIETLQNIGGLVGGKKEKRRSLGGGDLASPGVSRRAKKQFITHVVGEESTSQPLSPTDSNLHREKKDKRRKKDRSGGGAGAAAAATDNVVVGGAVALAPGPGGPCLSPAPAATEDGDDLAAQILPAALEEGDEVADPLELEKRRNNAQNGHHLLRPAQPGDAAADGDGVADYDEWKASLHGLTAQRTAGGLNQLNRPGGDGDGGFHPHPAGETGRETSNTFFGREGGPSSSHTDDDGDEDGEDSSVAGSPAASPPRRSPSMMAKKRRESDARVHSSSGAGNAPPSVRPPPLPMTVSAHTPVATLAAQNDQQQNFESDGKGERCETCNAENKGGGKVAEGLDGKPGCGCGTSTCIIS